MRAFAHVGYERSRSVDLDPGTSKVALFVDQSGEPTHAARQLQSGYWTSKLGQAEDIEHELLALESDVYGTVAVVLARPITSLSHDADAERPWPPLTRLH